MKKEQTTVDIDFAEAAVPQYARRGIVTMFMIVVVVVTMTIVAVIIIMVMVMMMFVMTVVMDVFVFHIFIHNKPPRGLRRPANNNMKTYSTFILFFKSTTLVGLKSYLLNMF